MITIPVKQSNEIWKCSLDVSAWVIDGIGVSSATVHGLIGSIVVSQIVAPDQNTIKFRVAGGEPGSKNQFSIVCTMVDGQVLSEEFSLFVA